MSKNEQKSELSELQLNAITLLLTGRKIEEILSELKIPRSTFTRWKSLKAFKNELRKQRQELLFDVRNGFYETAMTGKQELIKLATNADGKTPHKVRLEAAKSLWESPFTIHKEMELLQAFQDKGETNEKLKTLWEKLENGEITIVESDRS